MNCKAVVARCCLALGAGQRIFFVRFGVQKDGEVLSHRLVAQVNQLLRRGTHHHPVVVLHRQAQQGIPNRATDHVNLHGGSVERAPLPV